MIQKILLTKVPTFRLKEKQEERGALQTLVAAKKIISRREID